MKKIILCILGCFLLLMWTDAIAEECAHENLLECSLISRWEDLEAGHQWVEIKNCVCDDCGRKLVNRDYGQFVGHTFYMSESIHFEANQMHLWVFICPDCWHVTLVKEGCLGGDQCLIFHPQAGERPPVQYCESLEEFLQQTTTEDFIKRWLAQDRSK